MPTAFYSLLNIVVFPPRRPASRHLALSLGDRFVSLRAFRRGDGGCALLLLGSVVEAQNKLYAACVAANGAGNCGYSIDFSALVTRELVLAGAAMGVVALIPVAVNWYKKRSKNHAAA